MEYIQTFASMFVITACMMGLYRMITGCGLCYLEWRTDDLVGLFAIFQIGLLHFIAAFVTAGLVVVRVLPFFSERVAMQVDTGSPVVNIYAIAALAISGLAWGWAIEKVLEAVQPEYAERKRFKRFEARLVKLLRENRIAGVAKGEKKAV